MEERYKNIYPLFGSYTLRKFKMAIGRAIKSHLPIPLHVFNHLRLEINAFWVRLNNRINPLYLLKKWRIGRKNNLSVNIGCGPFGEEGWINLDLMQHKNVYLRYDCRKLLPFKDDSVARIRCEQFLEHLDLHEHIPVFLKECLRILKKDGVLRIIVPDAQAFQAAYQSGAKERWLVLGWDLDNLPQGFHTRMDIINHIFHQGYEHAYGYDFETLELVLKKAGFARISKLEFGISADSKLTNDLPNHKPHSLYVETLK